MYNFYRVYYSTYHNGVEIYTECSNTLTNQNPEDFEIEITWDNLQEVYYKYGVFLPFNIWNFKRTGLYVSFFSHRPFDKNTADIYKKRNDLNITLKISYRKYSPSLKEIFKWHDGETAIKYLIERGISITPHDYD